MNKQFRAYLVWGIAAVFSLYQVLMQGSISVMIPDLREDLLLETVQIGFLSSCFFYTYILFQIPAGFVIELFGPRRMLTIATLTYAGATLLFAFSTTLTMAVIARLSMGLMSTLAIVNAFCLAARWFSAAKFALLVGLTEMVALFGGIIGEGALAHLVKGIGWRSSMLTCSGVALVLLVLTILFVRDWPQPSLASKARPFKEEARATFQSLLFVIRIKQVWVLGIFTGLLFAVVPAFGALWSVPYLMDRYEIEKHTAATFASIFFLGIALSCPFVGFLAMKLRKRLPLILWGTSFSLIMLLLILYIPHIPLSLMAALLFFLGSGVAVYGPAFAIASDFVPLHAKGIAMGLINMLCISFGAPLLQPLIGALIEAQDYKTALSVLPVTLFLAIVAALMIRERGRQEQEEEGLAFQEEIE